MRTMSLIKTCVHSKTLTFSLLLASVAAAQTPPPSAQPAKSASPSSAEAPIVVTENNAGSKISVREGKDVTFSFRVSGDEKWILTSIPKVFERPTETFGEAKTSYLVKFVLRTKAGPLGPTLGSHTIEFARKTRTQGQEKVEKFAFVLDVRANATGLPVPTCRSGEIVVYGSESLAPFCAIACTKDADCGSPNQECGQKTALRSTEPTIGLAQAQANEVVVCSLKPSQASCAAGEVFGFVPGKSRGFCSKACTSDTECPRTQVCVDAQRSDQGTIGMAAAKANAIRKCDVPAPNKK